MLQNFKKDELNKLSNLFESDENNKIIADFYLDLLRNSKDFSYKYNKSKTYINNIIDYFDCNDFIKYMDNIYDLKNNFIELDESVYKNNPYVKNIKLSNIKENKYQFKENKFKEYEPFIYKDIEINENNIEHTAIGYFTQQFSYISLMDDDDIWMLITPHEINTMQKAIDKANGKVITFGLGLGYFSYMCSIKENVTSITIIEKDQTIINLFNKYILPQFEYKEKIKIIKVDGLEYIDNKNDIYDYVFVDLYKDELDGLPIYIKLVNQLKKWQKPEVDFWIENAMLMTIKRCVITALYDEVNNIKNIDVFGNYFDELIEKIKISLRTYEINSYKDISKLLKLENIKKLIYSL